MDITINEMRGKGHVYSKSFTKVASVQVYTKKGEESTVQDKKKNK